MAESPRTTMKRLDEVDKDVRNLEGAVVQIGEVLVDRSARMDTGFCVVREEILGLRDDFTTRLEQVTSRPDRLIEVTIKDRALGLERWLDLERRLARLEARAGF